MTEFDVFLIGGIGLTFVGFVLSIIGKNKPKEQVIASIIIALIVTVLYTVGAVFGAYHYNWESSILHISAQPNTSSSENVVPTTESLIETTDPRVSTPQTTYGVETEAFLGEAFESHTPDDGITASVNFRAWDPGKDKDLRNNTYAEEPGTCYYSLYSNTFNAIGGGGSEGDRINSEIHIPLINTADMDFTDLYLVGAIVAEQGTQGSSAYADVAILIDGVEKWRNEDHITSTTVQPIEFTVSLADVKSEIVIKTSCIPLDNGLALGFVGIGVSQGNDLEIQEPSRNVTDVEDEALFARAFESHLPHNNGVDFVDFRSWDTFSDADLRTEQYIDTGGLFIKFSNTFSSLGSSIENQIESEIHLVINPRKELSGGVWTGLIVAEQSTQGSSAYANVAIYVDGIEKWRTSEALTGNTVAPVEFSVDLSDAQYEVIIKTYCTPNDNGLALGFVNMDFRYS